MKWHPHVLTMKKLLTLLCEALEAHLSNHLLLITVGALGCRAPTLESSARRVKRFGPPSLDALECPDDLAVCE